MICYIIGILAFVAGVADGMLIAQVYVHKKMYGTVIFRMGEDRYAAEIHLDKDIEPDKTYHLVRFHRRKKNKA